MAANHRRKAYRRHERPDDFAEGRAPLARHEATQEHELDRLRQAEALQRALDALSDKLREVFVLYEIEELPMLDVAGALGIPRFTAYSRLRDARKKVAAMLMREGHVPGAVLSKAHGGAG